MAEFYKVLTPVFGSDKKFSPAHARGSASVDYEIGKLTTAPPWLAEKGYDVTVFRTLKAAADFARGMYGKVIFRAAVMGPVTEPLPIAISSYLRRGALRPSKRSSWPKGTAMVKGVIPLAEVPRSEWPK